MVRQPVSPPGNKRSSNSLHCLRTVPPAAPPAFSSTTASSVTSPLALRIIPRPIDAEARSPDHLTLSATPSCCNSSTTACFAAALVVPCFQTSAAMALSGEVAGRELGAVLVQPLEFRPDFLGVLAQILQELHLVRCRRPVGVDQLAQP